MNVQQSRYNEIGEKKYIHGFLYLCLFLSQKNDFDELNNFNLFLYLSSAIFIFFIIIISAF